MNSLELFKETKGDQKKLEKYEEHRGKLDINYTELWDQDCKYRELFNFCFWNDPQFINNDYFVTCKPKVLNGITKMIICKDPKVQIEDIENLLKKRMSREEYLKYLLKIFADNFSVKNMFYLKNGNKRKKVGIAHMRALDGEFKKTYIMYLERMRKIMSEEEIFADKHFKNLKEYYDNKEKGKTKLSKN